MHDAPHPQPLSGIKVLELGQLVAGPMAGTWLAWLGADVIKVEPPGGDPIRTWRGVEDGVSLWWRTLGRNKRCISLDLRSDEGRAIVRRLVAEVDVLVENFRPGTLERWGLDPEQLRREHPQLVVARVSGFGQSGPYARRPGYASVCEAMGGLRHLTGHPGEPPVRTNLSLGDSLAALHTALGIMTALYHRDARHGGGQIVDSAIAEAVMTMTESLIPEQDRLGHTRGPSGSTITGVVPSNAYPCADGKWLVIGANGESLFKRLCGVIERPDLATEAYASNTQRVAARDLIDGAIGQWTSARTQAEAMVALAEAEVPFGPIYSSADIVADPHYQARQIFESVQVNGRPLKLSPLGPKLSATPGRTHWAGPTAVGAHTDEVLGELLGLPLAELEALAEAGVIVRGAPESP
ncbi:MAG: CaiB/BaiF CoA transferase family protein [Bradymonadia bacterium]